MSGLKVFAKAGAAAIALSAAIAGSAAAQQPDGRIVGVWRGIFNDGYGTNVEFVLQANGRFSASQISVSAQTFYGGYWSIWQGNNIRFDIDQWQTTPIATIPPAGENWIIVGFQQGQFLQIAAPTCNNTACVVTLQQVQ
jgi:hypothetical protein